MATCAGAWNFRIVAVVVAHSHAAGIAMPADIGIRRVAVIDRDAGIAVLDDMSLLGLDDGR